MVGLNYSHNRPGSPGRLNSLEGIMQAISAQNAAMPDVEKWQPDNCGKMDIIIRKDGSWWHEGAQITRKRLIELFAKILRKDADGKTYLVTPVEKIEIRVECAHFLAVNMDVKHENGVQYLFFTTNMGDIVRLDDRHRLEVITDRETLEPTPLITVRGRLDALLTRPVFYELAQLAQSRKTLRGNEIGVMSAGIFFPLAPAGILD